MQQTLLLLVAAFVLVFGGPRYGGGMEMRMYDREPSFLRNVSAQARRDYFNIYANSANQTRTQTQSAVNAWAQSNNVATAVTAYQNEQEQFMQERRANASQAISQLPQAFQQLTSIETNDSLTQQQQADQITALLNSSSPSLQHLLFASYPIGKFIHFGGDHRGRG